MNAENTSPIGYQPARLVDTDVPQQVTSRLVEQAVSELGYAQANTCKQGGASHVSDCTLTRREEHTTITLEHIAYK